MVKGGLTSLSLMSNIGMFIAVIRSIYIVKINNNVAMNLNSVAKCHYVARNYKDNSM